jgi:hypothetical protein
MLRSARSNSRSIGRRTTRSHRFERLEQRQMLTGSSPVVTRVEVASTQWTDAFVKALNGPDSEYRGYTIPVGSSSQSATLAWDNINQIVITFDRDVCVEARHLSLTGVNVAQYHFQSFHYDPITFSATWTLNAAINNDRLRIDLDANGMNAVRALNGTVLDGDWVNNASLVSGNGASGGDFEFNFNVLPTDVNNTSSVSSYDYVYIHQLDGKTSLDAGYIANRDINGNGVIDSTDWQKAIDRALQVLPSGVPAGVSNDAPTAAGFTLFSLYGNGESLTLQLSDYFADLENGAGGLTYSIVSNSNGSLFDSTSITASKTLVLNATNGVSGRSQVTIRATDGGGLSVDATLTVDVNRENLPPSIEYFNIGSLEAGVYLVSGRVVDGDDNVAGTVVYVWGLFSKRVAVDEQGEFAFPVLLAEDASGIEYALACDIHGASEGTAWAPISMT